MSNIPEPGQRWERRDLLPGPSVLQWSSWALWGGCAAVVGGAGAVICGLTVVARTQALDAVTLAFVMTFLVGCIVLFFCVRMMERKEKQELAAGYTTSKQGHYEVERRHSPTGLIVRKAGQPALTRDQEAAANALVRDFLSSRAQGR